MGATRPKVLRRGLTSATKLSVVWFKARTSGPKFCRVCKSQLEGSLWPSGEGPAQHPHGYAIPSACHPPPVRADEGSLPVYRAPPEEHGIEGIPLGPRQR